MQRQDFEQSTLVRLHQEFPALNEVSGAVIFRADEESQAPTFVAWSFNENVDAYLREQGLKERITRIIEQLITNRFKYSVMPVCEGVIEFMQGQFMIEWRSQA